MKKKIIYAAICSALGACVLMTSAGCSAGAADENRTDMVNDVKSSGVIKSDSVETVRLSDRTENPFEVAEEKTNGGDTCSDDNGCDEPTADQGTAGAATGNDALTSDRGAARPAELTDEEISAIGSRKFGDVFGSNANGNTAKKTKLRTNVFDKLTGDNIHFAVMEYACAGCGEYGNTASSARAELQRQGDRQAITIEYDFGSDSYSDTTIIKDGKVYELDNIEKTYYTDELCMGDLDTAAFIGDFENCFSFAPSLEGTMEIKGAPVAYEVYDLYGCKLAVYFLRDDYCKVEMYDGMSGLLCGYETITLDMPINEALFDIPADYTEDKDLCDGYDDLDDTADEDDEDEPQWGSFKPDEYDWNDLYNGSFDPEQIAGNYSYDRDALENYLKESRTYLNGLYQQLYGYLYGENGFSGGGQYNLPFPVGDDLDDDFDYDDFDDDDFGDDDFDDDDFDDDDTDNDSGFITDQKPSAAPRTSRK